MIVRISTEGQYRLASAHLDELNEIDNRLVETVSNEDAAAFRELFSEMLCFVREKGEALPAEEIVESDIILPAPDTTIEEAKDLFTRKGMVPD